MAASQSVGYREKWLSNLIWGFQMWWCWFDNVKTFT